ncbi:MAG: hypothetical protein SGI74_14820 [Oligoflexia bacterium]|nr:hypothetical protein [Oligoflexia bacterium]
MRIISTFLAIIVAITFDQASAGTRRTPRAPKEPPPPIDYCALAAEKVVISKYDANGKYNKAASKLKLSDAYKTYSASYKVNREAFLQIYSSIFTKQNEYLVKIANEILLSRADIVAEEIPVWKFWKRKPVDTSTPLSLLENIRRAIEHRYRVTNNYFVESFIKTRNNYFVIEKSPPQSGDELLAAMENSRNQGELLIQQSSPFTWTQLQAAAVIAKKYQPLISKLPQPVVFTEQQLATREFKMSPEYDANEAVKKITDVRMDLEYDNFIRTHKEYKYSKLFGRIKKQFELVLRNHFRAVAGKEIINDITFKKFHPADRYDALVSNERPESDDWLSKKVTADEYEVILSINRETAKVSIRPLANGLAKYLFQEDRNKSWSTINLSTRESKQVLAEDLLPANIPDLPSYIEKVNALYDNKNYENNSKLLACFPKLQ